MTDKSWKVITVAEIALEERIAERDTRIAELEAENAKLKEELEAIKSNIRGFPFFRDDGGEFEDTNE